MEQAQIELLSEDLWTRLAAAESVSPAVPAGRYALRAALAGDRDARVRAQAAATLGQGPALAQVADWLTAGLLDPMPSVREACVRAIGRHRASCAARECERLATTDPVWWVRRSALVALAMSAEVAAIPALRQTLGDPFWRVRHAAVQALTVLAEAHPAQRERILAAEPGCKPVAAAALWYLRARFDPSIDIHKFPVPDRADQPLWNADPAVTTARLRARPAGDGELRELVALLSDPHEPLRQLAAQRLGAYAGLPILRGALRHLEVPGMPHALETTWSLLDGLGERARCLAAEILADPEAAPGALRWAASWTVRARCEELFPALAAQVRHSDERARAAVAEALAQQVPCPVAALTGLLDDADASVRAAAAAGLCHVPDPAAMAALQSRPAAAYPPAVRAALVAHAGRTADCAALAASMTDPHPGVRSLALAAQAQRGCLSDAEAGLRDPDPWIRSAALRAAPAAWLATLTGDPDAQVRRQALRLALGARRALGAAARAELAQAAVVSPDRWIRARSCELLAPAGEAELRALLRLSRDEEPMVRAAAAATLDALPDGDSRLRALLGQPGELAPAERGAVYARLLRDCDAPAATLLQAALGAADAEPPRVLDQLRATALLFSEELRQSLPASERQAIAALGAAPTPSPPPPAAATAGPRRALGRTGLQVSPLALSGAHELTFGALQMARQAGVNLFFTAASQTNPSKIARLHRQDQSPAASFLSASSRTYLPPMDDSWTTLRGTLAKGEFTPWATSCV